jgi:uncharacterized Zn finger protein (UPF0148 family)
MDIDRNTNNALAAAYCSCQTVFEYEQRDLFSGDVFCPLCMTRIEKNERYSNLDKAMENHPEAQHYSTI